MRDLFNLLHFVRSISPAAAVGDNTPIVGQIVNRAGFEQLCYAINVGGLADADATFTVLVEHGDQPNLSDAVAVPDSQLTGTENAASFKFDDDNEMRKIGYVGSKQYSRLTITPAGNSGNAFVDAIAVLGGGRYNPPAVPA